MWAWLGGGAEKVVLGEWCWRARRVKRSVAGKGRRVGSGRGGKWMLRRKVESGGVVLVRRERRVGEWCW